MRACITFVQFSLYTIASYFFRLVFVFILSLKLQGLTFGEMPAIDTYKTRPLFLLHVARRSALSPLRRFSPSLRKKTASYLYLPLEEGFFIPFPPLCVTLHPGSNEFSCTVRLAHREKPPGLLWPSLSPGVVI